MKVKWSVFLIIFLLLIGCSNSASQNTPKGDDPASWINFKGNKYDFYKTDVSVGNSLVSTNEKTDADDGTESGLEIFKVENDNGMSLFIQDPINEEWVEYRIK
ncbi:hypothetical protein A3842_09155 [Paenibacillus sp. P3E]|uniref:hypothetical protein n=1 Tax=Paenibacillus sp. P3E TaxID=1349435 RepID=UPI00093CE5A5|nr:hypothetical protein [Paenibacillus sp. P3E]OKP83159.1 hypothetical protein A3842_09155 [Paenibacillus sp. P3E]